MEERNYLKKDLHFVSRTLCEYVNGEDNFFIGILNKEGNKIKDVLTNQIIKVWDCKSQECNQDEELAMPLYHLAGPSLIALITYYCKNYNTPKLLLFSEKISSLCEKDSLTTKEIAFIKNTINSYMDKGHKKWEIEQSKKQKNNELLETYKLDESERIF